MQESMKKKLLKYIVLCLGISFLCHFTPLLYYILEGNVVLFTSSHVSESSLDSLRFLNFYMKNIGAVNKYYGLL